MAPRGQNQRNKRSFLTLKEKGMVLELLDDDLPYSQIIKRANFKISKGQITKISKGRAKIQADLSTSTFLQKKKNLGPKHMCVETDVLRMITRLRDQRMPVSMSLSMQKALTSAKAHNISNFKASRGWVENFLRRNSIQASISLSGKAADTNRTSHTESMQRIKDLFEPFEPQNVYNEDESALLYRAMLSRTYFTALETRRDVRGTSQMQRKDRLTAVYCTNATGSHKLPIVFIGKSRAPRCLRDRPDLKPTYYSQGNAWMDNNLFEQWLQYWYAEVQKLWDGPWLLLLDNCSGHKNLPELDRVTYAFLPPNTTSLFQPMDQGVIAACKQKYRTVFLRRAVESLHGCINGNALPETVESGRAGIREGRLPHISDAMDMLNEIWNELSSRVIMKCWVKADCLPERHKFMLRNLIDGEYEITQEEDQDVSEVLDNLSRMNLDRVPDTPVSEIARELSTRERSEVLTTLRQSIPNKCRLQALVTDEKLVAMYNERNDTCEDIEPVQEGAQPCEPQTPYTAFISTLSDACHMIPRDLGHESNQCHVLINDLIGRVRTVRDKVRAPPPSQ